MPRFAWWLMVAGVTAGLAPLAGGASVGNRYKLQLYM